MAATAVRSGVPVTAPVSVADRAVTVTVAGVGVTSLMTGVTAQDMLSSVTLLAHQSPRGVRVAWEKRGWEKVQRVNGVTANARGVSREGLIVGRILRQKRRKLGARRPKTLPNSRMSGIELKIRHAKTL